MRVLTFRLLAVLLFSIAYSTSFAQTGLQTANRYLSENAAKFNITPDVQWRISDEFTDANGITHVYYLQTNQGIDVDIQLVGIHVKDGEIFHSTGDFFTEIARAARTESISATQALQIALADRELTSDAPLTPISTARTPNKETLFQLDDIALQNIKVGLLYVVLNEEEARLVWEVDIYEKDAQHWWTVRVDAVTSEVVEARNKVLHCDFGAPSVEEYNCRIQDLRAMSDEEAETAIKAGYLNYSTYGSVHTHTHECTAHTQNAALTLASNSYRALPLGVESPNHGSFTLLNDPAAKGINASPFGWHDTDGVPGAEYTITRGNNVYAQEDQAGFNGLFGAGYSPDGGANLCFDWAFDPVADPQTGDNLNAAITNLFVWNNFMHDIFYNYGFTEECGNYQENNYGNGGAAGDPVMADAQDGLGTNNANFAPTADGTDGRLQMFLWDLSQTESFTVNTGGGGIAGTYTMEIGNFGAGAFTVTGDLVLVEDGTGNNEGCNALTNAAALAGNIALIDRGNCEFGAKCLAAENAGAIAAVVCNNVAGAPIAMGPGAVGASVTIPSVMISQGDCATIRAQIPTVNVTLEATPLIDGDFDAGIIAHEYGHGISTRLTGGASSTGCITNGEQMGEGWSDFWGLVLTVKPGDNADTPRGIGTYALGQPITGGGIRPFPYTRDMSINPHTYADMQNEAAPHGVGSVWCVTIWDLYWNLVDVYGYDTDLYFGTGGNNVAMRLVTEACKLQPCSPGFVDGRDAILAADAAIYGGVNECIIWETFARRGVGQNANQNGTDQGGETEDFTVPAAATNCIQYVSLAPKVFLQGPLSGSLMDVDLNTNNLVPVADPYMGSEMLVGAGLAPTTGPEKVVDWVMVEIRDAATGATVVASRPALVQSDGDVVSSDGVSPVTLLAPAGNYHVAIRHRNHLGVMTNAPVALN